MKKRYINFKDPDTGSVILEGAEEVGLHVEKYHLVREFLKKRLKGTKYENGCIADWMPLVGTVTIDDEPKATQVQPTKEGLREALKELGIAPKVEAS